VEAGVNKKIVPGGTTGTVYKSGPKWPHQNGGVQRENEATV